ncbi:MAG TPA: LysM peptidoglycan-binding domain-containing protein [Anaerolineae bacterium]
MKRLLILASITFLAMGAAACTREKPTNETPPATQVGVRSDITSAPGTTGVAASTPVTITTPVAITSVSTAAPTQAITTTVAPVATAAPLATSTPAPTSAPLPAIASNNPGTYTVQWGDTLFAIAARFSTTTGAISAANPGLNPNLIVPGQVLNIPAAGTQPAPLPSGTTPGSPSSACVPSYTVQRGDWVYELARRFGVGVNALIAANPGFNPNLLYPGKVLNIPCGGGTVPATPGPSTGGGTYTVRLGDTLFAIAVRNGTTVYALQIANHLPNPNAIYQGQVLIIPH